MNFESIQEKVRSRQSVEAEANAQAEIHRVEEKRLGALLREQSVRSLTLAEKAEEIAETIGFAEHTEVAVSAGGTVIRDPSAVSELALLGTVDGGALGTERIFARIKFSFEAERQEKSRWLRQSVVSYVARPQPEMITIEILSGDANGKSLTTVQDASLYSLGQYRSDANRTDEQIGLNHTDSSLEERVNNTDEFQSNLNLILSAMQPQSADL